MRTGQKLKELRKSLGLNRIQFAEIVGVNPKTITFWENEKNIPSQSNLFTICNKCNLPDDYFEENVIKNVTLNKPKILLDDNFIKIPYWTDLPEELKHKEYSYVLAQRVSIEQGWNLKPESLCITVMNGDAMENYWYKIRNNDVLIVDTNETKVNANGSGVYFATSRNNTMFWIREMQALYNGDIEFHSYAPSGTKTKVLTQQQLSEADFKIIGKVIKNVSFRL